MDSRHSLKEIIMFELIENIKQSFQCDIVVFEKNTTDILLEAGNVQLASMFYTGVYFFQDIGPDGEYFERVVVNEEILSLLTEEELRGALLHEVGHLRKGHPEKVRESGTKVTNLSSELELEADRWAYDNGANPLALASALEKLSKRAKEADVMFSSHCKPSGFMMKSIYILVKLHLWLQHKTRIKHLKRLAR